MTGDPQFEHVYPWLGFRLGIIGNLDKASPENQRGAHRDHQPG
jgi:hypothetical protein